MKINLTKKEYGLLIDLLEIADWVLNAYYPNERKDVQKYKRLQQKIYSYAKQMGFNDLISYDKNFGQYFPSKKYEETSKIEDFIQEFENNCFWEELIERLTERDFIKQEGLFLKKMTKEEFFQKYSQIREKYEEEFSKNGLANLYVRNPNKS